MIIPAVAGEEPPFGSPVVGDQTPADSAVPQDSAQPPDLAADPSGQNAGITVDKLAQVDPASVGLIDQLSGGFPADMWARSQRPFIERLLAQLPSGIRSPALQDLQGRLLLTAAVVPAGEGGTPDFMTLRLRQLEAMGDLPQALDLIGRLPPDGQSGELTKFRINGLFLTGDAAAACDLAGNLGQDDAEPYWTEVMGFCQVKAGNAAAGNLAVEMLQEKGVQAPVYFQLMQRLGAGPTAAKNPVNLDRLDKLDPLLFAMIEAAGLEIPSRLVDKASPLMVRAMATVANLPMDLKVVAGEKAALNGSLTPEMLAQIYGAVPTPPADGDAAAGQLPGAKGNARLYQAARDAENMAARGPLIEAIWSRAKASGTLALQARVNAPMLTAIEPSLEALPYAGEIMRLLVLAGKNGRAMAWYDFIKSPYAALETQAPRVTAENPDALRPDPPLPDAPSSTIPPAQTDRDPAVLAQAARLQTALWPWAAIADSRKALGPDGLENWRQSLATPASDAQRDRTTLLFSLLDATGFEIPAQDWASLMEGNPFRQVTLPTLPYCRALQHAAKDKRLGETVLLSLIVLGKAGPEKASPLILEKVIGALEAVGLDGPAREVAAEALAARDF